MIKLYSPENEAELSIIKSLFDAEGIVYYVLNDHFGTMKTGPKIDLLNAKTLYVAGADLALAREIVTDLLDNIREAGTNEASRYCVADKIRMVLEALIFGWFIPGNRWGRKKPARKGHQHAR